MVGIIHHFLLTSLHCTARLHREKTERGRQREVEKETDTEMERALGGRSMEHVTLEQYLTSDGLRPLEVLSVMSLYI